MIQLNKNFKKASSILMLTMLLSPNITVASDTVNIDNFVRAESDNYFKKRADSGYFGKLVNLRKVIDIDNQPVVRGNRDTLYSYGIFDLTSPVSITLPEHNRFQSIRVVNQDHYILQDTTKAGKYVFTQESAGSRYIHVNIRTLVNPDDKKDIVAAHLQQDKVVIEQEKQGMLELPEWNLVELGKLRKDILSMAPFVPNSLHMFGSKEEVTEVRHLIGTAGGWGGGPAKAVLFLNQTPEKNDGKTSYSLTVKDVPVDGFWSISVYNKAGYFEKNPSNTYSLNNLTAKPNSDGSITINFGGDPKAINYLYIPKGWNYTVRMYLPQKEVLDGSWIFPKATLK